MNDKPTSRRLALKQLTALGALGALGTLRATPLAAAISAKPASDIAGVSGKIIKRQDGDYELWRQSMVWKLSKPDRYPDLMVQATSEEDVIAAVKYAAKNGLRVAVHNSGHNSSRSSVRDGGMLIDVSAMSNTTIDGKNQIAAIQPCVRSAQLLNAALEKGLSFPVPHCPSLGMSGFLMGGGFGWNYAQHGGFSTFSIVGAEIVTADGKLVKADAQTNPDLFWAVRGVGPGFFGVITRFYLQLYPVPKSVMKSSYTLPFDDLHTVTSTLDSIRKNHDMERVEITLMLLHNPEAPPEAPAADSKICLVTVFAFEDSVEQAAAALAPFAQSALGSKSTVKTENQQYSYDQLFETSLADEDVGGRIEGFAVDNVMTDDGSKTLEALADHFRNAPTKDSRVVATFNMKVRTRPDSCISCNADTFVACYAIWRDPAEDARNVAWLNDSISLMDPFAVGHYINHVEGKGHPDRFRQCFTDENWQRLQQLRAKHDPNGVFHSYLGHS